ncbi:MAG TPA: hypothetical protein H9830_12345 [Candidatus Agrococcus pullicola]|uniref:Uncharacterized protein n=1 Tax=Candidatus Agrococcus pullicola TaxID=2838429 RepID=A0A9D1YXR8_9MICO|nr:hypothetical protein [Candidatus Agrococcus pullicola]
MEPADEKPEWFITRDGTVLQTWPPGLDNDRLKYLRYKTTRTLTLQDLQELDRRLDQHRRAFERRSRLLIILVIALIVLIAAAWLVLLPLGVSIIYPIAISVVGLIVLVIAPSAATAISGGSRWKFDQIYLDAGFASSEPRTIKTDDALAMINAPGTVRGN